MSDTMRMRRVLTIGELRREIVDKPDIMESGFGTKLFGVPLRWHRFDQSDGLLKVELIEVGGELP